MSSYNASSDQRRSQHWRNELSMETSEQMPLNATAFLKDFQQKYAQAQQGPSGSQGQQGRPILAGHQGQHGQQGQQGQNGLPGYHCQNGRNIQTGQHNQPGLGLKGPQGQPGLRDQPGQSGQPGQSSQPSQAGQHVLAGATVCCDQANCSQAKIEQIYPEQYAHEPATPPFLQPDGPQVGLKEASPSDYGMYCPCGLNRGQLVTICCTGRDCDESTKIDDIQMGPPEEKRAKERRRQSSRLHSSTSEHIPDRIPDSKIIKVEPKMEAGMGDEFSQNPVYIAKLQKILAEFIYDSKYDEKNGAAMATPVSDLSSQGQGENKNDNGLEHQQRQLHLDPDRTLTSI